MADLVSWTGLSPIYYDINPMTLTADSQLIESKINENTAAVLGVHPIVNCFLQLPSKNYVISTAYHLSWIV